MKQNYSEDLHPADRIKKDILEKIITKTELSAETDNTDKCFITFKKSHLMTFLYSYINYELWPFKYFALFQILILLSHSL